GSDSELRDVFLNLVFNALDAMPDGGRVTVRAEARADAADASSGTGGAPGHVVVSVADTGRGMSPEVRSRIFTPFFSTKGERRSGLGPAIALNVTSQHGGPIDVETARGVGTTMRVLLPVAPPATARAAAGADGAPARVLLAIAEPLLRTQLTRALER